MNAYTLLFLIGCSLVAAVPLPTGDGNVAVALPAEEGVAVSMPTGEDIPVPVHAGEEGIAVPQPTEGDDVAVLLPIGEEDVAFPQLYPEAAYEEGSEVDYETNLDVALSEILSHTINIEAPSPFGHGVTGEEGPNSVIAHIADLPAGVPFEADFETEVDVGVHDSKFNTLNVKVQPHHAF